MPRPSTCHAPLLTTSLVISVVMATSVVSSYPRERRQFFTTCWGWGAGCSMHSAVGRAITPTFSSSSGPLERRKPAKVVVNRNRFQVGIPSIVTSGGWEPGVMGKRTSLREQRLLEALGRTLAGRGQQV